MDKIKDDFIEFLVFILAFIICVVIVVMDFFEEKAEKHSQFLFGLFLGRGNDIFFNVS